MNMTVIANIWYVLLIFLSGVVSPICALYYVIKLHNYKKRFNLIKSVCAKKTIERNKKEIIKNFEFKISLFTSIFGSFILGVIFSIARYMGVIK